MANEKFKDNFERIERFSKNIKEHCLNISLSEKAGNVRRRKRQEERAEKKKYYENFKKENKNNGLGSRTDDKAPVVDSCEYVETSDADTQLEEDFEDMFLN